MSKARIRDGVVSCHVFLFVSKFFSSISLVLVYLSNAKKKEKEKKKRNDEKHKDKTREKATLKISFVLRSSCSYSFTFSRCAVFGDKRKKKQKTMRAATSSMFTGLDNNSPFVTLKVWSSNGTTFEQLFASNRTTFGDVKMSAIRHLLGKTMTDRSSTCPRSSSIQSAIGRTSFHTHVSSNDVDNYKLISMESKRTVDDKKTLNDERVKDGGELAFVFDRVRASISA
jgi:hypothetical protein